MRRRGADLIGHRPAGEGGAQSRSGEGSFSKSRRVRVVFMGVLYRIRSGSGYLADFIAVVFQESPEEKWKVIRPSLRTRR